MRLGDLSAEGSGCSRKLRCKWSRKEVYLPRDPKTTAFPCSSLSLTTPITLSYASFKASAPVASHHRYPYAGSP